MLNNVLFHQRILVAGMAVAFCIAAIVAQEEPLAYWLEVWWLMPIIFAISLAVNTAGISGAALYIPFFILVFPLFAFPLSGLQSVRLGLVIESFGLISSALAFWAFGLVDKRIALYGIVSALPLVLIGVFVSSLLPEAVLFFIIGGFLIVSAVLLYFEKQLHLKRKSEAGQDVVDLRKNDEEEVTIQSRDNKQYHYHRSRKGHVKRSVAYAAGGWLQGAAGFGIGEIGIISMILSHIPIRVAIGTSHLIVAITAIVASFAHVGFSFVSNETIPWNVAVAAVPAVAVAGQLAPYVAARISEKRLERFISFLFLVIGSVIAYLAVQSYI